MKNITLSLIRIYKIFISGLLELLFGKGCRFSPTCSEYAKEAVEKYGVLRGSVLSVKRISKCHPFYHKSYYDPLV